MSAVWRFFEPNEPDCQMCKNKPSLEELRETDCTAQPLLMKGKDEHVQTVVTLKVIQIARNICHHLFRGLKGVSSIKRTV